MLKSYTGSRKNATILGSGRVDGRLYTRIYLSPQMRGTAVISLFFETMNVDGISYISGYDNTGKEILY